MCENNTILCEKKENNRLSFIKNEEEFIEIIENFIEKKYNITLDGKNMILSGDESYIYSRL